MKTRKISYKTDIMYAWHCSLSGTFVKQPCHIKSFVNGTCIIINIICINLFILSNPSIQTMYTAGCRIIIHLLIKLKATRSYLL